MDKNTFFRALSDEAAQPDPRFIAALSERVVGIVNGTVPPPSASGFSTTHLIAAAITTTAVIAGVTVGIVNRDTSPAATISQQPVTTDTVPSDENVLFAADGEGPVDDGDAQDEKEIANNQQEATEVTGNVVSSAVQGSQSNEPAEPSSGTSTDSPGEADSTSPEVDQSFTVEFWTVPLFKMSPSIPTTPADFILSGVENIDFNWGEGKPGGSITKNHFVARATATKVLEPGKYILDITADDGVRVFIDGKPVHNRWSIASGGKHEQISFAVNPGSDTTKIVIEYFEFQESAQLTATIVKQ